MTEAVRRVHCTNCHPDGGDIERDGFMHYALAKVYEDGETYCPKCPACGNEMYGMNLYRNGHSANGLEPN